MNLVYQVCDHAQEASPLDQQPLLFTDILETYVSFFGLVLSLVVIVIDAT